MKSKFVTALLSLAIAFGLWMYVTSTVSTEDSRTYYDVPVTFVGETAMTDRNLMVTGGTNATVDLRIAGPRSELDKLSQNNITVKVDLATVYDPGIQEMTYTYSFPGDVSGSDLKVENRSPENVTITVDNKKSEEVPVKVVYTGSVPENFICDTDNAILDNQHITVSGPESVLEQIDHARIDVDLEDRTETISEAFIYTLCDAEGRAVNVEKITTHVAEVRLDLKIQYYKEIKLIYTLVEGGGANQSNTTIELKPETVRVSGGEAVLAELNEINLGTINLAEISSATQLTFPINLPEGVTNLTGVTEAVADVQFIGLGTKELTIDQFQVINVPEDLNCELVTEALKITLRGPKTLISTLTEENITVTVDLTGREVSTTPITINGALTFDDERFAEIGAVGPISVTVTLTEKAAS